MNPNRENPSERKSGGMSRRKMLQAGARAVPIAGAALFAHHFLKEPYAVPVPRGRYDKDAQLFVDVSGKPILVADCTSPAGCLSSQQCQVWTNQTHKDTISDHYHVDH